jgi:hypothetical protein
MPPTKREYDENRALNARLWAIVKFLVPLAGPPVRLLWRIGPIGRLLRRTSGGRVGAISGHAKRGKHDKAAELAIETLKEYRHVPEGRWGPSGRDYWWLFMQLAAENLEACGDREKMDQIIEMSRDGVEPFEGYDVAASYLAFSRWKYKVGDHGAATEFADLAARADPTWAEPDFVLGWYCLALGGGGAIDHLTKAVRKEPGILFRIAKDPLCRRHPHILARLKELARDSRMD